MAKSFVEFVTARQSADVSEELPQICRWAEEYANERVQQFAQHLKDQGFSPDLAFSNHIQDCYVDFNKIEGTAENWENGRLGESEEHAKVSTTTSSEALDRLIKTDQKYL